MKNLFQLLLLLLLTLGYACGPADTGEEGAGEETTEAAEAEAAEEDTAEADQPMSPRQEVEGMIGSTGITMNFGSPSVCDRQSWGELVPYGEVWRTGANEATTVTFANDVVVEGEPLAAGKYSVFTIPGEEEWTIIFNKQTGQWGTNYDESQDALRVQVEPQMVEGHQEAMTFNIEDGQIVLRWEKLAVPIDVEQTQGES